MKVDFERNCHNERMPPKSKIAKPVADEAIVTPTKSFQLVVKAYRSDSGNKNIEVNNFYGEEDYKANPLQLHFCTRNKTANVATPMNL